jgi:hypothetical protein
LNKLALLQRTDGEFKGSGVLVDEEKGSGLGEDHAPRDIKNRPE